MQLLNCTTNEKKTLGIEIVNMQYDDSCRAHEFWCGRELGEHYRFLPCGSVSPSSNHLRVEESVWLKTLTHKFQRCRELREHQALVVWGCVPQQQQPSQQAINFGHPWPQNLQKLKTLTSGHLWYLNTLSLRRFWKILDLQRHAWGFNSLTGRWKKSKQRLGQK